MEENNYLEIRIQCTSAETREMLVAALANIGFDGFEETDAELKAYAPAGEFEQEDLQIILNQFRVIADQSVISRQNWNAVWESNFQPVRVDDFAGVRASFHPPFGNVRYELLITPKMSFGTGHHATTWQVMKMMEAIDFNGKSVFDFGTGTGILAILAAKMGAARVLAVDNDDWCIENASENCLLNGVNDIDIQKVDTADGVSAHDVVIANINRHIILANLEALVAAVNPGGTLLISGLLTTDEGEIVEAFTRIGCRHRLTTVRDNWIAICFNR